MTLFPVDGGGISRELREVSPASRVVGWVRDGVLLSDDPLAGGLVQRVDPVAGRGATWADIRPRDPAGIMNLDLTHLVVTPSGDGYAYSWHRAMSDLYLVEGWA